jgi:hypothetical protein
MSSGFKQMLLSGSSQTCVGAPVSEDLCLTHEALTWYLALPSSWRQVGFIGFIEFVEFIEFIELIETRD